MSSIHSEWTRHENKLFEIALAEVDPDSPHRFEKIASKVPGKTIEQVEVHYQKLVDDIEMIESDEFPILDCLTSDCEIIDNDSDMIQASKKRNTSKKEPVNPTSTKGIPWTEEEHRNFLIGLNNCGKGDWRNISRNYVRSRTPTQVASHAQKYFLRNNINNNNSSSSMNIHDRYGSSIQAPPIKMMTNNIKPILLSANTNYTSIAHVPYLSAAPLSSASFSSSSSTNARTTTSFRPASKTSTALRPSSNFNTGSSWICNPKVSNNIGNNYGGSSSYSSMFMSSTPSMVPQQQYHHPLHDQYPITNVVVARTGSAMYDNTTVAGYNNIINNNNGTRGTTSMLLNNYQQATQIQLSSSSYVYNTGLLGEGRSNGSGTTSGVDDHLASPSVAAAIAAETSNISIDANNNNTTINHPYTYDQPIYSPTYDPDLYPEYI